jgi:hypothetical protein
LKKFGEANGTAGVTENPYAPPSLGDGSEQLSLEEATRQRFINHETAVKSISSFLLLGALYAVLIGPLMLLGGIMGLRRDAEAAIFSVVCGCLLLFVGIVQVATAFGIRRLEPWARTIATILSVFYLLAIPVGPFIGGYCLYLLLSQKGAVVFSEEYKRVIEQTPHIRYKTSVVVVVLVAVLVILFVGLIVAFVFGGV